jgi:acetate kinase
MSGAAPRRLLEGKSEADPETAQVDELLAALDREGLGNRIAAVGHRVVHGGDRFTEPVRIDDRVLDELDQLSALAPLHNPRAVATIRALRDRLGSATPQVATFDTAFHARMPATATTYAVPRRWRDELGVRRYGFHGLAHRYMAERAAQLLGRSPAATRLVTLQLGNGCSVAAIAGGRSVETSMGLTPNEGLVMGTRSGDVSPDVVDFVARRTAGNPLDLIAELTKEAGLLGLAGAGDVRELEERQQRGDRDAALALEVFCHRARRYLGGYLALLGGADAVVFGGGIGENSPGVREGIAGGLDALGITLDPIANADVRGSEARISSGASRVAVYVITVDEDLEICRDTVAALAR